LEITRQERRQKSEENPPEEEWITLFLKITAQEVVIGLIKSVTGRCWSPLILMTMARVRESFSQ
jgi:hypothetical protein